MGSCRLTATREAIFKLISTQIQKQKSNQLCQSIQLPKTDRSIQITSVSKILVSSMQTIDSRTRTCKETKYQCTQKESNKHTGDGENARLRHVAAAQLSRFAPDPVAFGHPNRQHYLLLGSLDRRLTRTPQLLIVRARFRHFRLSSLEEMIKLEGWLLI